MNRAIRVYGLCESIIPARSKTEWPSPNTSFSKDAKTVAVVSCVLIRPAAKRIDVYASTNSYATTEPD
jgi:hypothetical protein